MFMKGNQLSLRRLKMPPENFLQIKNSVFFPVFGAKSAQRLGKMGKVLKVKKSSDTTLDKLEMLSYNYKMYHNGYVCP